MIAAEWWLIEATARTFAAYVLAVAGLALLWMLLVDALSWFVDRRSRSGE